MDEQAHTERIVVGVDGSPSSVSALQEAQLIARALGAHLDAVAAWQLLPYLGVPAVEDRRPQIEADRVLDDAITAAFGDWTPHDLRRTVIEGAPAKVLVEAGKNARMVVVGNRGRGGFAGLRLGSVSSQVAQHAACSVLVVHTSTHD